MNVASWAPAPALPYGLRPSMRVLAGLVAAVAAIGIGLAVSRTSPILVIGLFVGAALAIWGLRDFPRFLWLFLIVRTTLDVPAIRELSAVVNPAQALTSLMLVLGLVYLLFRAREVRWDRTALAYALFIVTLATTLVVSPDPYLSVEELAKVTGYLLVYLATLTTTRSAAGWARGWATAILAAAVFPAVAGYVQLLDLRLPGGLDEVVPRSLASVADSEDYFGPMLSAEFTAGRLVGTMPSINTFALFLLVAVAVAWAIAMSSPPRAARRWLAWAGLAALVPLFVNTFSRGAWIALGLAFLVYAAARDRRLLLVIPVVAGLLTWLAPQLFQRFFEADLSDPSASTAAHRLVIWNSALALFAQSPLFGVGFGVGNWQAGLSAYGYGVTIHNDYLRVLVDAGLVGMAAYLLVLTTLGLQLVGAIRRARSVEARILALVALAVWVGLLAARATENVLTNPPIQLYFWALMGLAIGGAAASPGATTSRHGQGPSRR